MNKKIKILIEIAIFVLIITVTNNVYSAGITANPEKTTIETEEKIELTLSDSGQKSNISWSSSDSNIVKCTPVYKTSNVNGKATKTATNQATIQGIKSGTATIKVSYKWKNKGAEETRTQSIKITVNKSSEEVLKDVEAEEQAYKNAYKTVPSKNADAKTIKEFILSDEKYNDSKALKKVAKTDEEKIKAWYDKINEKIKSDRHYASENQYGSTLDKLEEIINAYDSNTSTDDAIDGVSTSGAADIVESSYERITIALQEKILGEARDENKPFTDIFDDISYYEPDDETVSTEITDKVSIVLTVITNIGMVLAVLMSAILGIKYMLGSVEEKADYKKDMIPYLVGSFLLFGICTIVKVLQQFGESINNI